MGTFGTDIDDNDEYLDIKGEFFELYNQGEDVVSITKFIIGKYRESFESNEDSNNFWLAIADLQWQCKALDDKVYSKIQDIVDSKSDLKLWRENDATTEDLEQRERVLKAFLEKISIPKKRARRRIKEKLYDSIFKKGDLLSFKLQNGKFGGALVINDETQTKLGLNKVIVTDIESDRPLYNDLFTKAYVRQFDEDFNFLPYIVDFDAFTFSNIIAKDLQLERIGNVNISDFSVDYLSMINSWSLIRITNRTTKGNLKLSNWIK